MIFILYTILIRGLRWKKRYYEIAERFTDYAQSCGIHPATLAMAWVMTHPAVTAPIIGSRTVEQLELALAAQELNMTPE